MYSVIDQQRSTTTCSIITHGTSNWISECLRTHKSSCYDAGQLCFSSLIGHPISELLTLNDSISQKAKINKYILVWLKTLTWASFGHHFQTRDHDSIEQDEERNGSFHFSPSPKRETNKRKKINFIIVHKCFPGRKNIFSSFTHWCLLSDLL